MSLQDTWKGMTVSHNAKFDEILAVRENERHWVKCKAS